MWEGKKGSLVFEVKRNLRAMGWVERGPYIWDHVALGIGIDLQGAKETKEALMHKIREGFRNHKWNQFMKSKRYDIEKIAGMAYPAARAKMIRAKTWGGDERCIFTGGIMSPLRLKRNLEEKRRKYIPLSKIRGTISGKDQLPFLQLQRSQS